MGGLDMENGQTAQQIAAVEEKRGLDPIMLEFLCLEKGPLPPSSVPNFGFWSNYSLT